MKHNAKRGEELPHAKLTASQVKEMRRLYAYARANIERLRKIGTVRGLAKMYGVDPATVSLALNHATWFHVRADR